MSHGRSKNLSVDQTVKTILSLHIEDINSFKIKEKYAKPIAKAAYKNRNKLSPLLPIAWEFVSSTHQQTNLCDSNEGKVAILQHAAKVLRQEKLVLALKKILVKITWNSDRSDFMDINLQKDHPDEFKKIKEDFKSQRDMCSQIIEILQNLIAQQADLTKFSKFSPSTISLSAGSSSFFTASRSSERSEEEVVEEKSQHSFSE